MVNQKTIASTGLIDKRYEKAKQEHTEAISHCKSLLDLYLDSIFCGYSSYAQLDKHKCPNYTDISIFGDSQKPKMLWIIGSSYPPKNIYLLDKKLRTWTNNYIVYCFNNVKKIYIINQHNVSLYIDKNISNFCKVKEKLTNTKEKGFLLPTEYLVEETNTCRAYQL